MGHSYFTSWWFHVLLFVNGDFLQHNVSSLDDDITQGQLVWQGLIANGVMAKRWGRCEVFMKRKINWLQNTYKIRLALATLARLKLLSSLLE